MVDNATNIVVCFWPGLGLPSQRPMLSYQKTEKTSKSAKYHLPLGYKKETRLSNNVFGFGHHN